MTVVRCRLRLGDCSPGRKRCSAFSDISTAEIFGPSPKSPAPPPHISSPAALKAAAPKLFHRNVLQNLNDNWLSRHEKCKRKDRREQNHAQSTSLLPSFRNRAAGPVRTRDSPGVHRPSGWRSQPSRSPGSGQEGCFRSRVPGRGSKGIRTRPQPDVRPLLSPPAGFFHFASASPIACTCPNTRPMRRGSQLPRPLRMIRG
jgi:hypothetical protein